VLVALAWVHDDLRRSLVNATQALRRDLQAAQGAAGAERLAAESAALQQALTPLGQAVGVLALVGLPTLAQVLRAAASAVQRLQTRPVLCDNAAVQVIEAVVFGVLEHLVRLRAGQSVCPLELFPPYREALQLAGADRVHPADLWPTEWQARELPDDGSARPRDADDAARSQMESEVLALLRDPGPAAARMSDLCADLGAGACRRGQVLERSLWQLAAAVYEAQAVGLLQPDVHSKRLASRLLTQLRASARGGIGPVAAAQRLALDLLFFCARARDPDAGPDPHRAPRLAAVRQAWALDGREAGVSLDGEPSRLERLDPPLRAQMRQDLAAAQQAWSALAGGEWSQLPPLAEQVHRLGNALRPLGRGSGLLAQALDDALAQVAASGEPPTAALAMAVAAALQVLDASLDDGEPDTASRSDGHGLLAARIDAVLGGAEAEPLVADLVALVGRVWACQGLRRVGAELRARLSRIAQDIDRLRSQPAEHRVRVAVLEALDALRGVLAVLGQDPAVQAVLHLRQAIDSLAQDDPAAPPPHAANQDRMADTLAALSVLVDTLDVQPPQARPLCRFDADSGSLAVVMGPPGAVTEGGAQGAPPAAPGLAPTVSAPSLAARVPDLPSADDLDFLSDGADGPPDPLLELPMLAPEPVPLPLTPAPAGARLEALVIDLAALDGVDPDEQVRHIGPLRIPIPRFNQFLNEAEDVSHRLVVALGEWSLEPQARPVPQAAAALAHTLAEHSAGVGCTEVATLSGALAHALERAAAASRDQADEPALFNAAADEIRRLLHQFAAGFLGVADAAIAEALAAAADVRDVIDAGLFPLFAEEADEWLSQLHHGLREWQARPGPWAAPAACLRTLHTFKGSARSAGAMGLGQRAHRLESAIAALMAQDGPTAAQIDTLLRQADALSAAFDRLRQDRAGLAEATRPAPGTTRVRTALLDRLAHTAGELAITRSRTERSVAECGASLDELSASLGRLRRQLRDIDLQADLPLAARGESARSAPQTLEAPARVGGSGLHALVRGMAESLDDVATVQRSLQRALQRAEDGLATQARLTRALQQDLLNTRRVPFGSLADRLQQCVRQAAQDADKRVRLAIVGGDIEVDRGLLERMAGPLEHLLRNSVAHGIEAAGERLARGKADTGLITVTVAQAGQDLVLECADDGAGLDLQRIRGRALAQGLIDAEATLSEQALAGLIFAPAFSTADTVTELAGRGLGLDVVRAEVAAMGGRIETASEAGQGTCLRLLLPLATAVAPVMLLRAGTTTAAVPAPLIEQLRRVPTAEVEAAYASGRWEGDREALPFHGLAALLQAGPRGGSAGPVQAVVVVRSAGQRVAVHVDEVLGLQDVWVRDLGGQLARLPGVAGVTLLPSGTMALVCDPVALAASPAEAAQAVQAPLVLVADDAVSVRRGLQRLLQGQGYRVETAKDGVEALELIARERPAVLIADIEMPRMDGFDLVRRVRADPGLAALPVIMITARIAHLQHAQAAELGVGHWLSKPWADNELLALITSSLASRLPRRPGLPDNPLP
jgi:chemosensory pili system protein ChpA (sensor histidine kinase/response regulator)